MLNNTRLLSAGRAVGQRAYYAANFNLARNHPDRVWDFYLKEDEILRLAADEDELWRRVHAAIDALELESLKTWMSGIQLDADGDLTAPAGD